MKMFMGVIAIGLLAVGALKYGLYLANGADDVRATVEQAKKSLAARQAIMAELAPTPEYQEAAPAEKVHPSEEEARFKFPRFMSPDGKAHQPYGAGAAVRGTGSVTANDVTRAKCLELADKWKGTVIINGVGGIEAAGACRSRNFVEQRF